jgi:hypothetical protein
MMSRSGNLVFCLGVLLLVVGCGHAGTSDGLFPEGDEIPGWAPSGDVQVYGSDNLYDLVNGQADSFFAYGFDRVDVQIYENAAGRQLRVEIWQMDSASNAYGLYTMSRSGEPVAVGNLGDADPGRRVDFWQDRAFVRVFAYTPEEAATLEAFAENISSALPSGGRPPSLVEGLPGEGRVEGSEIFFHQESSIQDHLWLGGMNILALGAETDGVLARYIRSDVSVWLLLVEYPDEAAAAAALDALIADGPENLSASVADGVHLGAVFGALPSTDGENLVSSALDGAGR